MTFWSFMKTNTIVPVGIIFGMFVGYTTILELTNKRRRRIHARDPRLYPKESAATKTQDQDLSQRWNDERYFKHLDDSIVSVF